MAATLVRQLYSRRVWLSDGTDTVWNFGFTGGYISKEHVRASIRDIVTGAVEYIPINYSTAFIGPYQLSITPPVPAGKELTIYRDTPKDVPIVDFSDGARISEVSLDTNSKQAVFIASEAIDSLNAYALSLADPEQRFNGVTGSLFDDEWGYKSMRHQLYTGISTVGVIDNGRAHYKTDATGVTVPNELKVEFLCSIINNHNTLGMPITFNGVAVIQGSGLQVTSCILAKSSILNITKVSPGKWLISGAVT